MRLFFRSNDDKIPRGTIKDDVMIIIHVNANSIVQLMKDHCLESFSLYIAPQQFESCTEIDYSQIGLARVNFFIEQMDTAVPADIELFANELSDLLGDDYDCNFLTYIDLIKVISCKALDPNIIESLYKEILGDAEDVDVLSLSLSRTSTGQNI